MSKIQLLGTSRFNQFNLRDRISSAAVADFEKRFEQFSQIPTIGDGWLAQSPSNEQTTSLNDAAYFIRAQKNL